MCRLVYFQLFVFVVLNMAGYFHPFVSVVLNTQSLVLVLFGTFNCVSIFTMFGLYHFIINMLIVGIILRP